MTAAGPRCWWSTNLAAPGQIHGLAAPGVRLAKDDMVALCEAILERVRCPHCGHQPARDRHDQPPRDHRARTAVCSSSRTAPCSSGSSFTRTRKRWAVAVSEQRSYLSGECGHRRPIRPTGHVDRCAATAHRLPDYLAQLPALTRYRIPAQLDDRTHGDDQLIRAALAATHHDGSARAGRPVDSAERPSPHMGDARAVGRGAPTGRRRNGWARHGRYHAEHLQPCRRRHAGRRCRVGRAADDGACEQSVSSGGRP